MTTMPRLAIQEQHQAMPGTSMTDYVVRIANRQGTPIPPRVDPETQEEIFQGDLKAELYRGLWICRCPNIQECSGAATVTSQDPIYMCPDCGHGWYRVIFPTNKQAIESEVLKRPTRRGGRLDYANWKHGETLGQLRFETRNLPEMISEGTL